MYVNNNSPNLNFGIKLDTGKVLEVTSLKIFQSEGIQGCKEVVNMLMDSPIKATGHKGFRYFAEQIGKKIMDKYPEIKKATDEIISITNKNPNIKKEELNSLVQPLINKLGKEIDINL